MLSENDSLVQSTTNITQSSFYLGGRCLSLITSFSVAKREDSEEEGVEFVNSPCDVAEDQLRKSCRLSFLDTCIVVEGLITIDTVFGNFQKQQIKHLSKKSSSRDHPQAKSRKIKKMVLFKNRSLGDGQIYSQNDKKNIVKNIVNAFIKFIKQNFSQTDSNARNALQNTEKLAQTLKYNNQLITAIIEHPTEREYFRQFLLTTAPAWLQQSKIKAKQIYDQALQLYHKLCEEREREMQCKGSETKQSTVLFRELQNYELQEQIRGFK